MHRDTKRERQDSQSHQQNGISVKRTKLDHSSPSDLSLAALSLQDPTPAAQNAYANINSLLKEIHVARFGDPELRERWWERGSHDDMTD
ncbi:hypothetical protein DM01DRAFT_324369 [Hesseltinella vesiculosa]|uniref:Uncharacterized protein n=1 Tax=Hesseltinella vesiculosa TaxID=101127 RepID=A0A1X2GWC8_9FUNG|nr:hypothetical protein DM01DRAFT_324369 [Hesseltinella vesiculosa]